LGSVKGDALKGVIMEDWLVTKLSERERAMYRIAMKNAKDAELVDDLFFVNFACGSGKALNPSKPPEYGASCKFGLVSTKNED